MTTLHFTFKKYLEERKQLHPNDDFAHYKKWAELTEMLSEHIDQTISLLNEATEDEVLYISEVFEDVALAVKSPKYIACLEKLAKKFPHSNLDPLVDLAKSYHSN